ncbi:hypothetical protein ALC53_08758 [Atta colombica]|uniref:Uncharacterized protein n=1 Tax=Atta colombica TaxID=520822 RepID=A0A195B948_9HYME|nr:hypothetical protein ALC53_08758 [Atta colombica]
MNAEQKLNLKPRQKTKSIISSSSFLFYTKLRLKLTQLYALTASSRGTQFPITLTAHLKQTRDATNRLQFVHFQLNRRTRIH